MNSKLPEDAFTFYVVLGVERSHDAVAKHFGVHKRTVTRTARREDWTKRLDDIEKKTRAITDAKLAEERSEMDLRHRKILRAMSSRVATAIQQYPLESGAEAFKGAETVIKLERLIAGEPTERTESIEAIIKRETAQFLTTADEDDWGDDSEPDDDSGAPAEATG